MAYKEIILSRKTRMELYYFSSEWTTPVISITFSRFFIIEFGCLCFRGYLLHNFNKTDAKFV